MINEALTFQLYATLYNACATGVSGPEALQSDIGNATSRVNTSVICAS